jgi:cysteine synthase B
MESAMVPKIYDASIADQDLRVESEDAFDMVRRLAREEGVMAGISSGAAIAAVLQVAKTLKAGVIVTVCPDGAEKYLTEKFWND